MTPKTPQQIRLHIEELLLHGFVPQDRHLIAQAVQRELTRLLVTGQAQGSAPFYEEKIPHNIEIPRYFGSQIVTLPVTDPDGIARETANKSITQATSAAFASAMDAPDPVKVKGSTETARYGSILRAHKLVGVRGIGRSYDGFYYVSLVKHVIERNRYVQHFELSREGTGSLSPIVRP